MHDKLYLRESMCNPHLIQRLEKPYGKTNPFSFGAGLKNGGLSNRAISTLKTIFSFDYMGAAEFEYGAVPAALAFIAEQSSLKAVTSGETQGVFYICPISYEQGVKDVIKVLIEDEHQINLKESCGLRNRVKSPNDWNYRNVGWLELDNGFFFFVDKEMFEKTKKLFGVK